MMYTMIISILSQSCARVSLSSQELWIYSDMEAINIMAIIIGSNKDEWYLYKSTTSIGITTRWIWDVYVMVGDGGDVVVDDEDRCLGLPDLCMVKMDPQWMSSPSRSLPEVRFRWFLSVLYVFPLIQFHGTKLFEMAVKMATIWAQLYGQTKFVRPYSWPLDFLESPIVVGFLLELLVNSKLTIFLVFDSFLLQHN